MKILIAATPLTGHLNPLLAIGRILIEEGHEVVGLGASITRDRFEAIGATFRAFPAEADVDLSDRDTLFPEWKNIPPGPERARFTFEHVYVDAMPAQYEGIRQALEAFPGALLIADNMLLGVLPLLLARRMGCPRVLVFGANILTWPRDDRAPNAGGLPPATSDEERHRYPALLDAHEKAVFEPVVHRLDQRLQTLCGRGLSKNPFEAAVEMADVYLQLTIPSFEYPRRSLPQSVRFVGALPIIPDQAPLPSWSSDLDGSRKVVLVTQGTLANFDMSLLLAPTLAALANESDLLVVATTGGRPIETIPGPLPSNARVARYLPFEWLLPKTDAFVTNGGYGSVNQALSFGIPLVTAGLTEDKAEVNTRVSWSGAGIDLKTNNPTPNALREAVRAVLDSPPYRLRASAMAAEFAKIDTRSEILRAVAEVTQTTPCSHAALPM
jgi:MGT family glycosyltransferase